jgi:hypothetical protein
LVDKDGQIVSEDCVNGEIHIHSPHAMKGYLNNPTATAEAFSEDGWIRSGDVGFVKEGKWYVIDRTKDLIKVRGWQVSPAEIEASLLEHPEVLDAAVIGMAAKDDSGEVPQAFIVRKVNSSLEEGDIKKFLAVRLARYKGVEDVQFVDSIPRNPTGKILRRVLRDSRRAQQPTLDPRVASVYSNAIKDLGKSQLERNSERGPDKPTGMGSFPEPSMAPVVTAPRLSHRRRYSPSAPLMLATSRPDHRRSESGASTLTEASTIESSGPATPPPLDESVKTSRKRKEEWVSPSTVKRRSARIGVMRVRAE